MNNNVENFIKKLENNNEYCFTLEISPQAKYDLSYIEEKINNSQIQNYADAFVVTDSPFANIKISPILAAIQLQQRLNNNKPFIATQTMRDKNSLALQNDLIGANYFDIRMILAVTGDAIANGNQKQAKGVFEGNSNLLIDIIKNLNKSKSLGEFTFKEPLKPIYPFCVINSYAKNDDSLKVRLAKKANSGLLKCIDELPLKEKPILVPGFFPVLTYKTAYFIYYKLSGSYIPEKWLSKLKKSSDKSEEEERKTAIELSSKLFEDMLKIHKKMHIMSLNNYEFVVDLLKNI